MKNWILLLCLAFGLQTYGQTYTVQGSITALDQTPIQGALIQTASAKALSSIEGAFVLDLPIGKHTLLVEAHGYESIRIPIEVGLQGLVLPNFSLTPLLDYSSLLELDDQATEDDQATADATTSLLHSSDDVYFKRSAMEFSPIFFKPRGYDTQQASLLINGIPMAKPHTGRALWANWGGLNDFTRTQEAAPGLWAAADDFGGAFGSTHIKVRPSVMRRGSRLSATASNGAYASRIMATHNSGVKESGWGYALSGSGRWTPKHTSIEGVPQEAYSLGAVLEYKANEHFWVNLVGIMAYNNRGKNAPLTSEAIALAGRSYNPSWGYQLGSLRNAKLKRIHEPFFILSHFYQKNKLAISANVAYQMGQVGDTRLHYSQGQNPDPTNYANMPSYYYNMYDPSDPQTDIYAFDKAAHQIDFFKQNKQIDWQALYQANRATGGESIYSLNEDITEARTLTTNILGSYKLNKYLHFNTGLMYQSSLAQHYQQINDLLGGSYLLNKSYFSGERYDHDAFTLKEGDRFQYYYATLARALSGFAQGQLKYRRAEAYAALRYLYTDYQREGYFSNNNIYTDAKGHSQLTAYHTFSAKAGIRYRFTGRHILEANAAYLQTPHSLDASFANIRQSNTQLPIRAKEQRLADVSYILRLPFVKARLTAYATRFSQGVEKSHFFTEARVGEQSAAFVAQTLVGIDQLHYGMELGSQVQLSPQWKLTGVLSLNKYQYTNNPLLYTSSDAQLLSTPQKSYIKGYYVAAGPQQVASLGVEYRAKRYWWAGLSANFFHRNYVAIAPITRTSNIYTDPSSGELFKDIDPQRVKKLLQQEDLGQAMLVNMNAGKSWRLQGNYLMAIISVNNLLNNFYKSGGFEQARKGNYQDMLKQHSQYPVFGNKYFVGRGTTFMLNVMYSF